MQKVIKKGSLFLLYEYLPYMFCIQQCSESLYRYRLRDQMTSECGCEYITNTSYVDVDAYSTYIYVYTVDSILPIIYVHMYNG